MSKEECALILKGLDDIEKEWQDGQFVIKSGDEDIHTAHERRLMELIGSAAGYCGEQLLCPCTETITIKYRTVKWMSLN